MNHVFIANKEPVFNKTKGQFHINGISAYRRGKATGEFYTTKARGPMARVDKYLEQLRRDGVTNIKITHHPVGTLKNFTMSDVTEIQWSTNEVSFL